MPSSLLRAANPSRIPGEPGVWFLFRGGELLLKEGAPVQGSAQELGRLEPTLVLHLGQLEGTPIFAAELPPEAGLEGLTSVGLRAAFSLGEPLYGLAGYAQQALYWARTSAFCGTCGHANGPVGRDLARTCPNCGQTAYPRVSPAVLVLIHHEDRVLLAQKPGWGKRYSIIAGFVDPQESLEECVRRETREEVGLEVGEIRYLASQPWPFPHQLMVAFSAKWVGGALKLEEEELQDARWFRWDELPELPPPISLSRQVIDGWAKRQRERWGARASGG